MASQSKQKNKVATDRIDPGRLLGPEEQHAISLLVSNRPGVLIRVCLVFNRRGYKAGWRRRVQIETERLPASDQTRMVHSLRLGFGRFSPTGAASGIESADVLFNITL